MDSNLLFVYGTLMRGHRNAHYLRQAKFIAGARTVREDFLVVGMTGAVGHWFPGAVAGKGDTSVHGELYLVRPGLLAAIDRHEGCDPGDPCVPARWGYHRGIVEVISGAGRRYSRVWMYIMHEERARRALEFGGYIVENGKWEPPRAEVEQDRFDYYQRMNSEAVDRALAVSPRMILDQPSPLALARARARFKKGG